LAKDISDAEMEALLLEHMPAPPDAMRELAQQRGLVVRDALVAKGLPAERLLLAAPKIGAAGAAGAASAAAGAGDKDVAAAARAQLSLAVN
jgi:outer membrane protein OmpA-like peptidoglycan-associated protein